MYNKTFHFLDITVPLMQPSEALWSPVINSCFLTILLLSAGSASRPPAT